MSYNNVPNSISRNSTLLVQGDELDSHEARELVGQAWRTERADLLKRKLWSQAKKNEYSLRKLSEIVDFAYENVFMYRELYSKVGYKKGEIKSLSDYEMLPSIDKAFLLDVPERDRIATTVISNLEQINKSTTSGSSGVPFTILFDQNSMLVDNLANFRMFDLMSKTGLQKK